MTTAVGVLTAISDWCCAKKFMHAMGLWSVLLNE
jgi:hypothetical protein